MCVICRYELYEMCRSGTSIKRIINRMLIYTKYFTQQHHFDVMMHYYTIIITSLCPSNHQLIKHLLSSTSHTTRPGAVDHPLSYQDELTASWSQKSHKQPLCNYINNQHQLHSLTLIIEIIVISYSQRKESLDKIYSFIRPTITGNINPPAGIYIIPVLIK